MSSGIVIFMEQTNPIQTQNTNTVQSPQPVSQPLVKKIPSSNSKKNTIFLILGAFLVVLLGIVTGWFMSGMNKGSTSSSEVATVTENGEVVEAGNASEEDDTAEGVLNEGGIEGEGTHYLDRNAGPDKMVYLTSTVVDLQSFVGKKVQVWGQTIASDNAPWLMDVGKIKALE